MKHTIYTLISYTPGESGWHDRCGDWISGKDSELQIHYFNDAKEAGKALGYAHFNNWEGENTLLINGIDPDDCDCIISEEEAKKLEEHYSEILDIASDTRSLLEEEKKKRLAEQELKRKQEEEQKKLEQQLRIEAKEKAELAKLLAKYGTK